MTEAKQKADELVEKFYELMAVAIAGARTIQYPMAVKAAIFHVEGIIKECKLIGGVADYRIPYWQPVLTYLQNKK